MYIDGLNAVKLLHNGLRPVDKLGSSRTSRKTNSRMMPRPTNRAKSSPGMIRRWAALLRGGVDVAGLRVLTTLRGYLSGGPMPCLRRSDGDEAHGSRGRPPPPRTYPVRKCSDLGRVSGPKPRCDRLTPLPLSPTPVQASRGSR